MWVRVVGVTALLFGMTACGNRAQELLEGTSELDVSVCDPSGGPFTLEITNPYLPYLPGQQAVLESGRERVQITVLDDTETVAGVTTRVVEEREWTNDELVEVSRNFVVQAPDGSVCYYGEDVDDYRNGEIVGHGGAWRAGDGGHVPGILMPGNPQAGTSHKQEIAAGVAEDTAVIVSVGEPFTVPAGTYEDTVETQDVDPLSGAVDPKRYARGVGLIADEGLRLVTYRG